MSEHILPKAAVSRRSLMMGGLGVTAMVGLSACGSGASNTPTTGAPTAGGYVPGSAQLKVELGKELTGVLYPDGYVGPLARAAEKFADGQTTYRVVTRSFVGQDVAGVNTFSKHLEEATGVKVQYEIVPAGDDGAPKLNAMMSSGDLPDAFMTGAPWMGGFTRSQLWTYGQQGMFLPLDELIDQYAPELVNLFGQFPELRKVMTAPDGKMYAFPSINQCYHCASSGQRTWIHTPSAEAIGVTGDSVSTLEDFEALLREFKAMGMIPMSGYIEFPPMSLIEAAYLNVGEDRLRRKDGQISYTPIEEAWREAMITTNRLVNEGLLDRNGFSQTKDQFTRLAMDPAGTQVAVLPGQSQGEFAEVNFSDPNARFREFQPLKPFTGPDGNAYVAWRYNPGHNVGLVLTSKTRNPEELIRWADYQTGLVSTLSMRLGTLDEHWEWAAEGDTGIDGRQAVYKKTATPSDENDVWWEMGPYNLVMDVRHGEFVDEPTSIEPALYRAGKMYEPFAAPEEEYFLEPFFTVEQAAQVGELKVNLDNAFTQGRANLALGNADPANDKDWENYVNSLKGAGLDRYLEILKAADDATNG